MAEAKKSGDIGMKRGRVLPNLPQPKQLDVIAEGLPILMKSAGDLLEASKALVEHYRAAAILKGHAMEELAKILILIDIVRCPQKLRPSRIGPMMAWFYDHLARLIYIDGVPRPAPRSGLPCWDSAAGTAAAAAIARRSPRAPSASCARSSASIGRDSAAADPRLPRRRARRDSARSARDRRASRSCRC